MPTAAEKQQLESIAEEKASLKKKITLAQERIAVLDKMEAALGGSATSAPSKEAGK